MSEQATQTETIGFDGSETEPIVQQQQEIATTVEETQKPIETTTTEQATPWDGDKYLKEKFGFDNEAAALEQITQLREKANIATTDVKITDVLKEEAEETYYSYLSKKKQLERAEKLDVSNPDQASELIQLNLKYKHPDLSAEEILDIFQETYVKPAKPEKAYDQDDADYQAELGKWKQQCDVIDKRIIREAKMARPEISRFKNELVLPDIQIKAPQSQPAAPTQEELAAAAKEKEAFLKSMDTTLNTFGGHKVTYKDEVVELPISYDAAPEEKAALKPIIDGLYSSYDYFDKRWSNPDGTVNHAKVAEDIHLLENKAKILQKIANESGNQRMKHQVKIKSNIDVSGGDTQRTQLPDAGDLQRKKEDAIWGIN